MILSLPLSHRDACLIIPQLASMQNYNLRAPTAHQYPTALCFILPLEHDLRLYTLGREPHLTHFKNKSLLFSYSVTLSETANNFYSQWWWWCPTFFPHSFNPLTRALKWQSIWETAFIVLLKSVTTTCFLPLPARKCECLPLCPPLQHSYRDNLAAIAFFQLKNLKPINSKYY